MKLFKLLIVGFILLLTACGEETPLENTPPRIELEADIECRVGLCTTPQSYTWAFGEDEEDGQLPCAFDFEDVNFDAPGSYTATCTVTDSDGDSASMDFDITVLENTPPVARLIAGADTDIDIEAGEEIAPYEWAFGEDEEDGELPCVFDFEDVNFGTPGVYVATCTVTDSDGDTAELDIPITIIDSTPPVVQKMAAHVSEFPVDTTVDFLSNVLIYDNSDMDLDIDINDELVQAGVPGTYDVIYTVTDDSGNITTLTIPYTFTSLIAPTFIDDISVEQELIMIDYEVFDPSGLFMRLDVEVRKEGELFYADSFFDVEYEIDIPVPSDTGFEVVLTYLYDMGGSQGVIRRSRAEEIMSDSWELPEFEIVVEDVQSEEAYIQVLYEDIDLRVLSSEISLYDGPNLIVSYPVTETDIFTFINLFTNHQYHIELEYVYDMNDGEGPITVMLPLEIETIEIDMPMIDIIYNPHVVGRITFDGVITNAEYVVSPQVEVTLYDDYDNAVETQMIDIYNLANVEFLGLHFNALYDVHFTYEYDLRDGNGVQTYTYIYSTFTHVLEVVSVTPLIIDINPGDPVDIRIDLLDDYGFEELLISVYIQELDRTFGITYVSPGVYEFTIPGEYLDEGLNELTIMHFNYFDPISDEVYQLIIDYNNVFIIEVNRSPI